MHNKDNVLGKLVAELDAVTKHFMILRGTHTGWQISAFVTADHTGQFVTPIPNNIDNTTVCVDGQGPTFESALEDALQKIALAAPQAVSA
ncbi:hypothetical protein [Rhodococcoides fascians]|uniref:hypothetical protein n=1 Tax=Rhodococcoides fascians TaxID=1828 RepID=UPI0005687F11|nr:hypothetical protein [Rhodococcus fascians]